MSAECAPLQTRRMDLLVSPVDAGGAPRASFLDAFSPSQQLSPARRLVLARLQRDALASPMKAGWHSLATPTTSGSDDAASEVRALSLGARLAEVDAMLLAMSPRMPAVLRQQKQQYTSQQPSADRSFYAVGPGQLPVALPYAGAGDAFPCHPATSASALEDHTDASCKDKGGQQILHRSDCQPDLLAMHRDLATHAAAIDGLHASIHRHYTQALEAVARWSVAAAAGGAVAQLQPPIADARRSVPVPPVAATDGASTAGHQQQQGLDDAAAVAGALVAAFVRDTADAAAQLRRTAEACRQVSAVCDVSATYTGSSAAAAM